MRPSLRGPLGVRCLAALVAVPLLGCGDAQHPADAVGAPGVTGSLHGIEHISRAVAMGLADPTVRHHVLSAMRASPLTEHKLAFQAFIDEPAGVALLAAAAAATGQSAADLRVGIVALPDLDFYVPARQQRLTWEGDAQVSVVARRPDGSHSTSYLPDGTTSAIDFGAALPPRTLFLLAPAESKGTRILAQVSAGRTIQDPGEWDLSGRILRITPRGDTSVIDLADAGPMLAKCLEDCGGGGGGGGGPGPQTFLESITTESIHDNNFPWESNEFEFRALVPGGFTNAIRIEGVPATGSLLLHLLLIAAIPPMWVGGENGVIAARETDAWPNADDYFFFTDLGYCGAVLLDSPDDNGALWYLTEGTCSVFALKNLIVRYSWVP